MFKINIKIKLRSTNIYFYDMTVVDNKETKLKVSLDVKCLVLTQNSHIFITHLWLHGVAAISHQVVLLQVKSFPLGDADKDDVSFQISPGQPNYSIISPATIHFIYALFQLFFKINFTIIRILILSFTCQTHL